MGVEGYHTRTNTLFSSILSQKTNNSSVPDVNSIKNSNCCRGRKLKRNFWVKDHFHECYHNFSKSRRFTMGFNERHMSRFKRRNRLKTSFTSSRIKGQKGLVLYRVRAFQEALEDIELS